MHLFVHCHIQHEVHKDVMTILSDLRHSIYKWNMYNKAEITQDTLSCMKAVVIWKFMNTLR